MTTPVNSRSFGVKGFARKDIPSLADIVFGLGEVDGLTPQVRSDLQSAVRVIGRVLALPLGDVPASPNFLRQRLARISPAAQGMTPRRWANVLSLLRRSLAVSGVKIMPGRYLAPLSAEWKALDELLTDRSMRLCLARLMHFASAQDIRPAEIDDRAIEAFLTALEQESLVRDTRKVWRNAIAAWNRACSEVPGWPEQRLQVPERPGRYWVEWEQLPESLRSEVERWLEHLGGTNFLADTDFKPLRPTTLHHRRRQIREYVSALVAQGRPLGSLASLATLVEPETAKLALRFFHKRAGDKRTGRMVNYGHLLVGIARHWTKAPEAQISALRSITKACDPGQVGMTPKNKEMLRKFKAKEAKLRLIELPYKIIDDLVPGRPLNARQAHRVEKALLIQLLLRAPMRLRNLANLRLDENFTYMNEMPRRALIRVQQSEVKNSVETVYPLSPATCELLQLYLERARPLIANGPTPFLFPGRNGKGRADITIRHLVADITFKEVGVRLTPHQFRHLAGKFVLDARPGCLELVRQLLHHKQLKTTQMYYADADQEAAVELFDEIIDDLMRRAG